MNNPPKANRMRVTQCALASIPAVILLAAVGQVVGRVQSAPGRGVLE